MCVFNDLHWGMSGEWTWGHHHHSRVCEGFQCHDTLSNGYTERRANIFLNDWADTKYMCTWHIRMCNALLLWHSCSDARLSLTFFSLAIAFSFALCVSLVLWMISRFFLFLLFYPAPNHNTRRSIWHLPIHFALQSTEVVHAYESFWSVFVWLCVGVCH